VNLATHWAISGSQSSGTSNIISTPQRGQVVTMDFRSRPPALAESPRALPSTLPR
jgi:hypothetical protein